MLFVSLVRRTAGHANVVTFFARLVLGVVIPEFPVRQYCRIQLDDVNNETFRVVGQHFKLIKVTALDDPVTYRAILY
jgi:hypothetical protein